MSDDFVKNFLENGAASKQPVPKLDPQETAKNLGKFFGNMNGVGDSLGYGKLDDTQGMVIMALVASYIAHHGTEDERRRFSALFNYFSAGFPELEEYIKKIILLSMFCSIQKGAMTLDDVFALIPTINPEVLDHPTAQKDIVEEFAKEKLLKDLPKDN